MTSILRPPPLILPGDTAGRRFPSRHMHGGWPPGFRFRAGTCGCNCNPPSMAPSSAPASVCANCAKVVFFDNFNYSASTSDLVNLHGYTMHLCPGDTQSGFNASLGALNDTKPGSTPPNYVGTGGSCFQTITTPALNGLCVGVCAGVSTTAATAGVVIANAAYFFIARAGGGNDRYRLAYHLDNNGCAIFGTTINTAIFGPTFDDLHGSVISLAVQDTSGGAGTYSILCYADGALLMTVTNVALSFTAGAPLFVGVRDTNHGLWGNLTISTN